MFNTRSPRARAAFVLGGLILAGTAAGCGSGNPNEKELSNAPPGKQTGDPNESFADRRGRTRNVSKQLAKIEARNEDAAKKKAAAAK